MTEAEEAKVMRLVETMGNKWSTIAPMIANDVSSNDVKNCYHATLRRQQNAASRAPAPPGP